MAAWRLLVLSPLLLLLLGSSLARPAAGAAERAPRSAAQGGQDEGKKKRGKEEPAFPRPRLGELAEAKREAYERNVPLIIVAIQEGEEANDRFYEVVYRHPAFVTAAAPVVLVLVNDGAHPTRTIREEGTDGQTLERQVCERFETPSCADHKLNFNRVHQEFNEDGALRTPQMVVLSPKAELRERFVDLHAVGDLTQAIAKATQAAGPGLSAEQLSAVKQHHGAATKHQEEWSWALAYREWTALLAIAPAGAFAEEAKAGSEKALAALRAAIDEALAKMQGGKVVEGYVALSELGPVVAGTPLEKDHKKALQGAERNKAWREAIEGHKRAVEADGLWKELDLLLAEDEVEKAKRIGERILRRFGDTPAAGRVRKEWPDLEQSLQDKP